MTLRPVPPVSGLTSIVTDRVSIPIVVRGRPWGTVSLDTLNDFRGDSLADFSSADRATLDFRLFWQWRLSLWSDREGDVETITYDSWSAARAVRSAVRALIAFRPLLPDPATLQPLTDLERALGLTPEKWIDVRTFQRTLEEAYVLRSTLERLPLAERVWVRTNLLNGPLFQKSKRELEEDRVAANERFIEDAKARYRAFLDSVEKRPLSEEQRRAVLTDEYRTLVVAAAGSGKTSVLVAKAGYLVESRLATSDQVCVIAFNTKAAQEVRDRIQDRLKIEPTVKTFHALGLEICGRATGLKPRISRELEQDASRIALLRELVQQDIAVNPGEENAYLFGLRTVADHLRALKNERFEKADGLSWWQRFLQQESGLDPVDIERAERQRHDRATAAARAAMIEGRSPQEVDILRFLRGRGLSVDYEPAYATPTADASHGEYRPDFLVTTTGPDGRPRQVYLEHQWLRRDGTSPRGASYEQKVRWARNLHARRGTTLVESFSWWWRDAEHWTARLARALADAGVTVPGQTRAEEASLAALVRGNAGKSQSGVDGERAAEAPTAAGNGDQEGELPDERAARLFYESLDRYIALARERGADPDVALEDASCAIPGGFDLLRVFKRIRRSYEEWLEKSGGIDFAAMIKDAAAAVRAGNYRPSWSHLLIDEFQDISAGRMALVRALLESYPDMKLFAVGDDWQAINRFAGSDIAIMKGLGERLSGGVLQVPLQTTFRCVQGIVDVSSRFILKNPAQIRKSVRADSPAKTGHAVTLHYEDRLHRDKNSLPPVIERVLTEIASRHERASVLVLARYWFLIDNEPEINRWKRLGPKLSLVVSTVHSAKGREADIVIVLGLEDGLYGFPSRRDDLPVLRTVLPPVDQSIEDAEERRLFYVALTRARKESHVVVSAREPSAFATEIEAYGSPLVRVDRQGLPISKSCPACGNGQLQAWDGPYGRFFGCSAKCPYKEEACPVCKRGLVAAENRKHRCQEADCRAEIESCPRCRDGWLVVKTNRQEGNKFLGCSNFKNPDRPCTYTRTYRGEYQG